jgi:ubiquinone/menaquinone biosynthesis C-methylase UbiE
MNEKGDANRFDRVDAENNPAYFVKLLDARRSSPEEAIVKRRIIDMLQPLEAQHVLDVGCGTGDDSREIASLVGLKGRVVGIDYSAAMVAEARRRTTDTSLPIEFHEGDAMKLGFADGSFDRVRSENVLLHLRDAHRGLEEMIRVVRPGGRVVASEPDTATRFVDSPYVALTNTIFASFADATPSGRIGRALARLMRESGLRDVTCHATVVRAPLAFFRVLQEGHANNCVQQGLVAKKDVERWWEQLEEADAAGDFHYGVIVFTAAGVR